MGADCHPIDEKTHNAGLLYREEEREMLPLCADAGAAVMAWSPLAGGRLMDPSNEAGQRVRKACAAMSAKYGNATVDQLAYAWIMAHPSQPMPIIGTNKLDRVTACVKAADIQLEREDWYALWVAAKGHCGT